MSINPRLTSNQANFSLAGDFSISSGWEDVRVNKFCMFQLPGKRFTEQARNEQYLLQLFG